MKNIPPSNIDHSYTGPTASPHDSNDLESLISERMSPFHALPQTKEDSGPAGSSVFVPHMDSLGPSDCLALVERIERSSYLVKAVQLKAILSFICHRTLHEHATSLREHEIAISALGRKKDFDPSADTIVRVQIAHLRKRLEQYFTTEGANEPIVLSIPKGTYIPKFELRAHAAPQLEATSLTDTPGESGPKQSSNHLPLWSRIAILATCGVAASLTIARLSKGPPMLLLQPNVSPSTENVFISHIFTAGSQLSVLTGDANLALMQNTLHTDISISDYVSKDYPSNLFPSKTANSTKALLAFVSDGRYTSYGNATVALACASLSRDHGTHMLVRYARFVNIRDFEHGNFVLIGSRRVDPWISLFEPKLNFIFEEDKQTHVFHFRNRVPLAGEQELYATVGNWSGNSTSYVDIALLPNLTKTGYVLLLDGTGMEATEAASEFVFGKDSSSLIRSAVGTRAMDETAPLEILLRVNSVQGTANNFDIVAVRKVTK